MVCGNNLGRTKAERCHSHIQLKRRIHVLGLAFKRQEKKLSEVWGSGLPWPRKECRKPKNPTHCTKALSQTFWFFFSTTRYSRNKIPRKCRGSRTIFNHWNQKPRDLSMGLEHRLTGIYGPRAWVFKKWWLTCKYNQHKVDPSFWEQGGTKCSEDIQKGSLLLK